MYDLLMIYSGTMMTPIPILIVMTTTAMVAMQGTETGPKKKVSRRAATSTATATAHALPNAQSISNTSVQAFSPSVCGTCFAQ